MTQSSLIIRCGRFLPQREVIPIGEKKLFLLDIDGTICVGNRLIPGADRFLNGLSEYGGDYVFITNNTTMSVADYRKKFAKLGIPTTSANFLTASVATRII